ncbi:hypothetical protein E4U57_006277 [Claviceps arundinis]|uniref:Peptidase M20 domain-containing protein 2 n=1 Tax=Claviceps arundinis TaxID=1623583 RepID=A0ABQ7PH67_9HYPO|nr:hypothetical protein E4U57_006277 [Claviceps arundinis]
MKTSPPSKASVHAPPSCLLYNTDDDFVKVIKDANQQDLSATHEDLRDIDCFIQDLECLLWPLNSFLHANPETAYRERKAHDVLTSFMKSRTGWQVTCSAYGMETAWVAEFDSGLPGPVVSFNAEMDALPNLGHACGHNLIAMVSLAAGLAAAEMMSRRHLPGKIKIIGTPAEEGGGGKIRCLEAGAYRDTDVSLISHPGTLHNSPLVRTTAFTHLNVSYHGRAAHAANSPWLGVNALDALVIAYNAISVLRQQTRPDDVIGLQITNGGNKPNVIHEYASGVAVLRSASAAWLQELQRKVEACFQAGAEATGARLSVEVRPGYMDHVPNRVLAARFRQHWQNLPHPPYPPLPAPDQPTWVKASTDQGNLSYALPSMNVSFAIPPGPQSGQPHSPDFEKAAGTRGAFDRAMRVAKAMTGAALDIYSMPNLLSQIQEQWKLDVGEHGAGPLI